MTRTGIDEFLFGGLQSEIDDLQTTQQRICESEVPSDEFGQAWFAFDAPDGVAWLATQGEPS